MATSAWQAVDSTRSLAHPTALSAACTCPAFCERDHANE
jgi:hypothetical protein